MSHTTLQRLAENLNFLLLDVDGVLTDGGIILIGEHDEAKRFNVHDGMGINLARAAGIKTGIVTSRVSSVVRRRSEELKIDVLMQGVSNKATALDMILRKYDAIAEQVAFIGDDIQDIPIMSRVGIPIAVQNASPVVKKRAVYVTDACGGHGAVREAIEWLLGIRGDLERTIKPFLD